MIFMKKVTCYDDYGYRWNLFRENFHQLSQSLDIKLESWSQSTSNACGVFANENKSKLSIRNFAFNFELLKRSLDSKLWKARRDSGRIQPNALSLQNGTTTHPSDSQSKSDERIVNSLAILLEDFCSSHYELHNEPNRWQSN